MIIKIHQMCGLRCYSFKCLFEKIMVEASAESEKNNQQSRSQQNRKWTIVADVAAHTCNPALGGRTQEGPEPKSSLGRTAKPYLRIQRKGEMKAATGKSRALSSGSNKARDRCQPVPLTLEDRQQQEGVSTDPRPALGCKGACHRDWQADMRERTDCHDLSRDPTHAPSYRSHTHE